MGYTCMLLCGLFCATFRAADRGCQPAPGLPCALLAQEGGATKQSSGDIGRENAKVCLRIEMRAIYNRHPRATAKPLSLEVRALRRKCAVGQASKGDGPAASGPCILRGSPWDALRPMPRASSDNGFAIAR